MEQTKQWTTEQVQAFAGAAMNILSVLPSSISPLTGENGEKMVVAGRKDTPKRFAKMMMEMLEGELYTNDEIVELFKDKVFTEKTDYDMVCSFNDINTFSFCEHHIALMYNIQISVNIDYKAGVSKQIRVIGLSKIPRICDLVCKRLQLQERITTDIHYIITKLLDLPVTVTVKGKHSCVSARGIKKDITFISTMNSNNELINVSKGE